MKKIEHFIIVTSLTACFFTLGLFLTSFFHEARELIPAKDPLTRPVVVLLPHQDDEMFMAGTLHHYIKRGRPVYALIVTDGAGSGVRKILNKRRFPLTAQTFSAARNREVVASLQAIGVHPSHVMFANSGGSAGSIEPHYRDGHLTKTEATQALASLFDTLGDGTYIAVASRVGEAYHLNPDHLAIEEALREFRGIREKIFFSDIPDRAVIVFLEAGEQTAKQKGLRSYYQWDPHEGQYAIGAHSVSYLLNVWQKNKMEFMVQL